MPARSLTPLVAVLALAPLAAADGNLFTYYSFAGLSTAPGDTYDMARCLDGTPTGIAVRPGRGADADKWLVWFGGWRTPPHLRSPANCTCF
jgi:hypothetical protein